MALQARLSHTHIRLLDAADRVVNAHGVDALTIEGAAAEAGISRAGAYRWFKGRRELLVALALKRLEHHLAVLDDQIERAETFAEKIEALFLYLPRYRSDEVIAALATVTDLPSDQAVFDAASTLKAMLTDARERHEIRRDVPVEQLVAWLIDQQWIILGWNKPTRDRILQRVRHFVLPSIAPTCEPAAPAQAITRALEHLDRARGDVDAAVRAIESGHDTLRTARSGRSPRQPRSMEVILSVPASRAADAQTTPLTQNS